MSASENDVRKITTRRSARETAVQALYQLDTEGNSLDLVLQDTADRCAFTEETEEYVLTAVKAIGSDLERYDSQIVPLLAQGWTFSRISKVDRAVLRLAVYELIDIEDMPPKVTINEAVSIAKHFGEPDSGRFINGLLGKLLTLLPEKNPKPTILDALPEEPEVEPEEEIIEADSPEYEEIMKTGAWTIRTPGPIEGPNGR